MSCFQPKNLNHTDTVGKTCLERDPDLKSQSFTSKISVSPRSADYSKHVNTFLVNLSAGNQPSQSPGSLNAGFSTLEHFCSTAHACTRFSRQREPVLSRENAEAVVDAHGEALRPSLLHFDIGTSIRKLE